MLDLLSEKYQKKKKKFTKNSNKLPKYEGKTARFAISN